jgi:hypothetical protein
VRGQRSKKREQCESEQSDNESPSARDREPNAGENHYRQQSADTPRSDPEASFHILSRWRERMSNEDGQRDQGYPGTQKREQKSLDEAGHRLFSEIGAEVMIA